MSEGIEHYVTESDGTPATGKNSVLRLFLESDNEYMVQVDGDDMITPYVAISTAQRHIQIPQMSSVYKTN